MKNCPPNTLLKIMIDLFELSIFPERFTIYSMIKVDDPGVDQSAFF